MDWNGLDPTHEREQRWKLLTPSIHMVPVTGSIRYSVKTIGHDIFICGAIDVIMQYLHFGVAAELKTRFTGHQHIKYFTNRRETDAPLRWHTSEARG
jgi:hypothetical protein